MFDNTSNEKELTSLRKSSGAGHDVGPVYPPRQVTLTNSLNEILAYARRESASDVHITSDNPVFFRKFGRLTQITTEVFPTQHIHKLLLKTLPQEIMKIFIRTGDCEYVHPIHGYGRFRLTLAKQRAGLELIARLIPAEIPKFAATGMPTSCASLIKWSQGLVLVTGPAGSGKTTTLATLVEMVNQRRNEHIITIEDPIEIVFDSDRCQISQRQMSIHTLSQNNALRAALREDPDVIVVGELRDMPTLLLAITAAETGHLVFGTMNTVNAVQTLSRLIDSFPTEEQQTIRNLISESLRGVICQQLVPRKDGSGVVPAYEILLNTPAIANHIRKGTILQIENVIVTAKSSGMILMNNSLKELVDKGIISEHEAESRSIEINI
jgi:twitching motility protein PilT